MAIIAYVKKMYDNTKPYIIKIFFILICSISISCSRSCSDLSNDPEFIKISARMQKLIKFSHRGYLDVLGSGSTGRVIHVNFSMKFLVYFAKILNI
jgi:hypothetical protein